MVWRKCNYKENKNIVLAQASSLTVVYASLFYLPIKEVNY